jgi:hypothetical protein
MSEPRFSSLSADRQRLVRECQRVGFGRIRGLEVSDGEPVFGPQTELLFDFKLDSEETRRPENELSDFALCAEILRLFSKFDCIRNGCIEHIEIRSGVPRRIAFKAPSKI